MDNIPYFLERFALDLGADERAIRRAYARELKLIDQEHDAERFQALRRCYDIALHWVATRAEQLDAADEAVRQEHDGTQSRDALEPAELYPATTDSPSDPLNGNSGHGQAPPDAQPGPQAEHPAAQIRAMEAAIEAASDTVVGEFLEEFYALAASVAVVQIETARAMLQRHLGDPRMEAIGSRDIAEARIAALLVEGWRRGHEVLLPTAMMEFGWHEDPRRLEQLGRSGAILNEALGEREHFFAQDFTQMELQRGLIDALRSEKRPSDTDLVKYANVVAGMELRYPNWFRVILAPNKVKQWCELARVVPLSISQNITVEKLDDKRASDKKSSFGWPVGIVIWLIYQLVKYIFNNS
jgi:protein TonB